MEGEVINRKHFPFWSLKMETFSVPSQGIALGNVDKKQSRPERAKALILKAFALSGRMGCD